MIAPATSYDELLTLARAGARVVHLLSSEWERVRGYLRALARDLARHLGCGTADVILWDLVQGPRRLDPTTGRLTQIGDSLDVEYDPTRAIRDLVAAERPTVLLMEDIHADLSNPTRAAATIRWLKEVARLPPELVRLLLLTSPTPCIPPELAKEVPTIDIPLPSRDTLREVLRRVCSRMELPPPVDDEPVLSAARGLTVMEADRAFARAAVETGRLAGDAVPVVLAEKERVIRESRVLEYFHPGVGLGDVGGLELLKQWLDRRGGAFSHAARELGLEWPRGVLLLGVQGCGKSLVSKAIASVWRMPLLRLDVGRVFGSLVGESEANIREALKVAQALAPCILWIDEIEKGLAGMGSSDRTDGGATSRVVGTLLTWLQEKTDPVFVIATANRIDLLPPELLRKGRFDEIFFVDLPSAAVRADILRIHLERRERPLAAAQLEDLAARATGFSGAELEEAVREALFAAFADGRPLRADDVAAAIGATVPLSRTMRDEIEALRRWARARARLATAENAEELPPPVDSRVPRLRQEAAFSAFVPEVKP